MFKETNATPVNETETIIGPSVRVEGDFITEGNIVVQGIICGTVQTSKNLKIGPNSKIFANVAADNALIAGEIQGNVKINGRLELTSTAKIFGDIKTEILIVAAGSVINGKCQMGDLKKKSQKPDFSKQEKINLKLKGEKNEPLKETEEEIEVKK